MKFKTSKREINAGYLNKISVSYCALQNLLWYEKPIAYTTRREGHASDIYEINGNTVIVTGCAPFGNIDPGYETCRKYDLQAEKLIEKYKFSNDLKEKLHQLLLEFAIEVTKKR